MIKRSAHVRELLRRVHADGTISHNALVSFDEAGATTIRLTAEEHALFESAMVDKRRFVMSLRVAAPSVGELVEQDVSAGGT